MNGLLFDPSDVPDVRARWAEYEAHFLPLPVAQQGVEACRDNLSIVEQAERRGEPIWIVDVGAGAGSIGVALRNVFPTAVLVAVEPREEELPNLLRHYDEVFLGPIEDFAKLQPRARFDLAISNPRWSIWGEIFDATWPIVRPNGFAVMHGPSTWGHSDEKSEYSDVFERHLPIEQWRVNGRVAYDGGCATDNRKVSWWAWKKIDPDDFVAVRNDRARHGWRCTKLPLLDGEQRRWRVRPGTEG